MATPAPPAPPATPFISDLGVRGANQTGGTTQASETGGVSTGSVRDEDIGEAERATLENLDHAGLLFANLKRTYDEFQQESLESIRLNRTSIAKILSDAQQFDNSRQNIANQALQNAVETANMVSKQAVRHSDLAIDRQWNIDEQGFTVEEILGNQTFKEGIRAAVVGAVNEALAGMTKK